MLFPLKTSTCSGGAGYALSRAALLAAGPTALKECDASHLHHHPRGVKRHHGFLRRAYRLMQTPMKGRIMKWLAVGHCSVHRAGEVLGPHDGENLFRGGRVCSEPRRLSQVSRLQEYFRGTFSAVVISFVWVAAACLHVTTPAHSLSTHCAFWRQDH